MKANIHTTFCCEWVLGLVIDYAWKLLSDAVFTDFTWRPRELLCWLKKWLISGNLAIWPFLHLNKVLFCRFPVPRGINSRFCSKTQWQMFLLVSGRHVGAHLDGSLRHMNLYKFGGKVSPHNYLLSFLRFWTFSIEFYFYFDPILNGVTLKTSNNCMLYFYFHTKHVVLWERCWNTTSSYLSSVHKWLTPP